MKRYTVPEELGSLQVFELDYTDIDVPDGYAPVAVWPGNEGDAYFLIAREHLTEVVPPLPKEPTAWSVVAVVDPTAVHTIPPAIIFQRWTSGWFRAGYEEKHEWPEVCALGTPAVIWTMAGAA